jgi:hypothetical protein
MKWIFEAAAQQVLGILQGQVADPILHGIQRFVQTTPIDVHEQRSFIEEVALLLRETRGKTVSGLRIVELGSGWHPVLPLFLVSEFEAFAAHTFDVDRHYSSARIAAAAREIMEIIAHLRRDPVLNETALAGRLSESI